MHPNKKEKKRHAKQAPPSAATSRVSDTQLRQRRNNQDIRRSLEASLRFVRWKGVLIVGIPITIFGISILVNKEADPLQILLGAILVFAGCNALYFLFHIIVPLIQRSYPGLIKLDLTQHETDDPGDDDRQSYSDEITERISRQSDENRWHEQDHGHRH